jgi:drug/metabolite transporter (DMT)-like permease
VEIRPRAGFDGKRMFIMRFKDSHHPWAMATILFWSLAYVLTRLALQHFTAFSLGFLRYFTASAALIVVLVIKKTAPPGKADWKWFALGGAIGFFLYILAFNKGCETVTSATGSVVLATVPVLTALMARFIHGEKLRGYQWAAMAVEFAGVAILTLMDGVFSVNAGLLYLLGAVVLLSSFNLLQRRLTKKYSGLQASAYSVLTGTVMLAVFAPEAAAEVHTAAPIHLVYVATLGVFSGALAYVAWANAFAKAEKASQVSNYMFVTPLLATVFGFLMANEVPDRGTMLGGGVILLGMVLFNFGGVLFRKQGSVSG